MARWVIAFMMGAICTTVLAAQPDSAKPAARTDLAGFTTIPLAHSAEDLVHIPSSEFVIAGKPRLRR
jgi:hypothetical protein